MLFAVVVSTVMPVVARVRGVVGKSDRRSGRYEP